jgi:hypothetical protein
MNFNRDSLKKLLALGDEELAEIVREIAAESGVDTTSLVLGKSELAKLRAVLSLASDEDIARMIAGLGGGKNERKHR